MPRPRSTTTKQFDCWASMRSTIVVDGSRYWVVRMPYHCALVSSMNAAVPTGRSHRSSAALASFALAPPALPVAAVLAELEPTFIGVARQPARPSTAAPATIRFSRMSFRPMTFLYEGKQS